MLTSDPRDALLLAHGHIHHRRDEAAAERLRRQQSLRRAFAATLRRAANRLDPAPLVSRSPRPSEAR